MTGKMIGKTLFIGANDNGLMTVLDEQTEEALVEMGRRAQSGVAWDKIHADTPYPMAGIAVFVPGDLWGGPLGGLATGTFSDRVKWLAIFQKEGGRVLYSEAGNNAVPLSTWPQNESFDHVRSVERICEMFGIPADQIRPRPTPGQTQEDLYAAEMADAGAE